MKNEWKKKVVIAGVSMAVCFTFAGCETQTTSDRGNYSGEIHAYAREEGSGTRGAFAQLVGFDGNAGKETQSDQTTSDAQIAENAEEIIQEVEANTAAIGYVSRGSMTDAAGIKALTVNGRCLSTNQFPCRNYDCGNRLHRWSDAGYVRSM